MDDFRHRAACRDVDPELFFPAGSGPLGQMQIRQAKTVCRRCAVTDQCLEWSLDTAQPDGVWGGTDPDERRELHRQRMRTVPHNRRRL
jgi:WhiB family transcriptional regulator, redox-sensing transcriptional regulator